MKRFESQKVYLVVMFILSVFIILPGCGGGEAGGGKWDSPSVSPTVTFTDPANRDTDVPVNKRISATFSEAMDPATITTTTFTLKQGTTAVPGRVTYTGVTAVFTPINPATNAEINLTANSPYTATVTTGARDLTSNGLGSNYSWGFTTSASTDNTAPTVTGAIHANNATGVAVNTKVGATFSEAMDPLTITSENFTLKDTASGISVAGTISYSGVSAVFIPSGNLATNRIYTVTVKGGTSGVKDLAGNPLAADFVISWRTIADSGTSTDTTAPKIIDTINANRATDVAVNTKIGATFSEWMDHLTINNVNFTLHETVSGAAVAGTVSYSGLNAVFTPLNDLALNTRYTATIKGGANGVKDLAGNPLTFNYLWSWTTGAAQGSILPAVSLVHPANLATGVAINSNVAATFSKAMDPLKITNVTFTLKNGFVPVSGLVTYDAITRIATFTPSVNLLLNTTYTATITTGAKDLEGNALATDKVWTFTTGATPIVTPSVSLAGAARYGTFGGTAGMTNQGILTIINGDIGTIATTTSTVTGFHDTEGDIFTETGSNIGTVNGTIFTCTNSITGPNSTGVNAAYCAAATQARLDAQSTYLALKAMPSNGTLAGNLAGLTINPGVYTNSSSVLIEGGDLTLDALGDANAVFVFQIGSTLTVGGPGAAFPQSIILAGGAQAKNVFWQVGTFATINAGGGGTMAGTIISQAGVSFSTPGNVALVTLNGRAISLGASVTMVNTVINVPAP